MPRPWGLDLTRDFSVESCETTHIVDVSAGEKKKSGPFLNNSPRHTASSMYVHVHVHVHVQLCRARAFLYIVGSLSHPSYI